MKWLVFINPKPGREDEYNEWYETVHRKDVLQIPGVVGARRYKRRPLDPDQSPGQYLVIYDVEGDIDAVLNEVRERVGTERMRMTDALDGEHSLMAAYEEI